MSIRKKLLIIPLLFVALIAIISYIYSDQSTSSTQLLSKIHDENFVTVIKLSEANENLLKAHSMAKELSIKTMLAEDSSAVNEYAEQAKLKLEQAKATLKKHANGSISSDNDFAQYLKVFNKIQVSCVQDSDAYSATQIYPELDTVFAAISKVINDQIELQKTEVQTTYESMLDKTNDDNFWFYLMVVTAVILSVVISQIISVLILRKLSSVTSMLKDIAEGHGDLTKRVEVGSHDEFGLLAEYFNVFVENVQGIMTELAASVNQLVSATENMSSLSTKTSDSMQLQMSKVEHVSTSMNQMTATVREVSQNIVQAASNADIAEEQTRAGQSAFQSAIDIIKALADNVRQASEVIVRLKDDSESIGGILDVIRGIAEQTNLLALNAAIEAARAGEQGRGFAVVADEVRTLATRTQQSTEEIQNMIESLQDASEQATSVMEHGISLSEKCEEQTSNASNNMNIAAEAIVSMSGTNTQVATAAEEQSAVAEEINVNITDINSFSQETSSIANSVAAAGQELSQLSNNLQSIIGRYKF